MRFTRRKSIVVLGISCLLLLSGLFAGCLKHQEAYLSVDANRCKSCAICISVCPVDAVRIINGKAVIDPSKCIECGKCVEVCPVNAIY